MTQSPEDLPDGSTGFKVTPARVCILATAGLAITALGLVAFLHSTWLRKRVAGAISSRIGHEVTIGDLSLTPRGKLLINDVSLAWTVRTDAGTPASSGILEIGRLRITPHWTAFFSPTLRLNDITIIGPRMVAVKGDDGSILASLPKHPIQFPAHDHRPQKLSIAPQPQKTKVSTIPAHYLNPQPARNPPHNPAGQSAQPAGSRPAWVDPQPSAADRTPTGDGLAVAGPDNVTPNRQSDQATTPILPGTKPGHSSPSSLEKTPTAAPDAPAPGIFIEPFGRSIKLDKLAVEGGSFSLYSPSLDHPLLQVEGYGMRLRNLTSEKPKGEIVLASLKILGFETARNLHLHLHGNKDGRMQFAGLLSDLHKGSIEGETEINFLLPGTPFTTRFSISGIDASRLPKLSQADRQSLSFKDGSIDISVRAEGFLAARESILTSIEIRGRHLALQDHHLFSILRGDKNIRGLEGPVIIRAIDLSIRSAAGTSVIDNLSVKTDHGIFKSRGYLYPDGKLEMAARIYISNEVAHFLDDAKKKAPPSPPFEFVPFHDTTWFTQSEDLLIGGTIQNPETNIWSPDTMTSIPQLIGLLTARAAETDFLPPFSTINKAGQ